MYIPIRCMSCGMPIGKFAEALRTELDDERAKKGKNINFDEPQSEEEIVSFNYVFEKYGLDKTAWCCRRDIMTYTRQDHLLIPPLK